MSSIFNISLSGNSTNSAAHKSHTILIPTITIKKTCNIKKFNFNPNNFLSSENTTLCQIQLHSSYFSIQYAFKSKNYFILKANLLFQHKICQCTTLKKVHTRETDNFFRIIFWMHFQFITHIHICSTVYIY